MGDVYRDVASCRGCNQRGTLGSGVLALQVAPKYFPRPYKPEGTAVVVCLRGAGLILMEIHHPLAESPA